jgi:predicted lipid-binding transport protein (Tim44 family)
MALLLALSDFINLSDPTVIGGLIVGAITIFAVGRFLFASDSAQPTKKADNVVGKGKEVSKDVPAARPAPVRTGVLDPSKFQKFALKEACPSASTCPSGL